MADSMFHQPVMGRRAFVGGTLVIALDHGKVIGDLGRAVLGSDGRLGVDQTLPTELEGLGGNVVTVVELGLLPCCELHGFSCRMRQEGRRRFRF